VSDARVEQLLRETDVIQVAMVIEEELSEITVPDVSSDTSIPPEHPQRVEFNGQP